MKQSLVSAAPPVKSPQRPQSRSRGALLTSRVRAGRGGAGRGRWHLNRAIADRFYGGELAKLEEVGAYSAGKVLTSVYKAFAAGRDYAGFLRRAAILHERFYNLGKMIVTLGEDGRSAVVHLAEAPAYSEADLYVAAGFYAGAGRLLGLEGFEYELRLEEDGAHFDLRWTPAPD